MRGFSMAAAVLMLAALPGAVFAQAFSFGFATGGGHHGHHHGCYSNWYGFDFYRPPVYRYGPPVVYAPPPVYVYPAPAVQVIQPAVVPVQPSPGLSAVETTTPSLSASSASTSSNSGVRLNSLPAQKQRANVVLRNPAENAGPVAFRVQDQVDAELSPGSARTWSDRTSLTVEFDRGGEFGATRKVLRPGNYEFVVTDEGWDLVAAVAPASNGRAASLQKNSLPGRR
jgi:hypothetical protein